MTAKTTLANSNGTTEKAYISAVAPLDAAYQISLSSAEKLHNNAGTNQKAIDIAQANRNYVDHKSTTQLNNAITAATNTFNSTKNSQNST